MCFCSISMAKGDSLIDCRVTQTASPIRHTGCIQPAPHKAHGVHTATLTRHTGCIQQGPQDTRGAYSHPHRSVQPSLAIWATPDASDAPNAGPGVVKIVQNNNKSPDPVNNKSPKPHFPMLALVW